MLDGLIASAGGYMSKIEYFHLENDPTKLTLLTAHNEEIGSRELRVQTRFSRSPPIRVVSSGDGLIALPFAVGFLAKSR